MPVVYGNSAHMVQETEISMLEIRSIHTRTIQEPLFSAVKCGKRTWFGHVTRHENLSKSNPSVILEDGCRRVGQRQSLNDNIKESTRCTFSTPVPVDEDRKMESVNARSS